jgi:hypothetical protein
MTARRPDWLGSDSPTHAGRAADPRLEAVVSADAHETLAQDEVQASSPAALAIAMREERQRSDADQVAARIPDAVSARTVGLARQHPARSSGLSS